MGAATEVSVLVLTRNEQENLPGCLESLSWSDDIHVYDSNSTDATVAIAERFGAHVIQREFDDWSTHQNWALRNIPFRHEWVYYSDADERVTRELAARIRETVADPGEHAAFRVRRHDYFMGKLLKHTATSPFNIRLFKPRFVTYERVVNPVTRVAGTIGDISAHFNHYPFSQGLAHWLDKHNQYSTLEAVQVIFSRETTSGFSFAKALFARDPNERRVHQKGIYYRLPLRPLLMFFLLYVVKRGFLDGRAGLTYAVLRSIYEYFIVLKTGELREQIDGSSTA